MNNWTVFELRPNITRTTTRLKKASWRSDWEGSDNYLAVSLKNMFFRWDFLKNVGKIFWNYPETSTGLNRDLDVLSGLYAFVCVSWSRMCVSDDSGCHLSANAAVSRSLRIPPQSLKIPPPALSNLTFSRPSLLSDKIQIVYKLHSMVPLSNF